MSPKPLHRFLQVRGVRLHVVEMGEGEPPIVLLHGSPGQYTNWKYVAECLASRHRVIVYDQRGYGRSDKPPHVTLEDYVEDLDAVMGALGLAPSRTVLAGHSFGAVVALEYAARKPVYKLVLVSPVYRYRADFMDKLVSKLPPLFWKRLFFTNNPLTRSFYRRLFFSPRTPGYVYEEFIDDNASYIASLPPHVFRYLASMLDGYSAEEAARRVRSPTLIIVGGDDKVTPPGDAEKLQRLIPGARLALIPCAGHMILYEKPTSVCTEIEWFIEGKGPYEAAA